MQSIDRMSQVAVLVPVRRSDRLHKKMRADYDKFATPRTEVVYHYVTDGPDVIESAADVEASEAGVVAAAREAVAQGADAIVLACFSEPGAPALLGLGVPVIGEGRPTVAAVAALHDRFAIISASSGTRATKIAMADDLGVAGQLVGVLALNIPVEQMDPHTPGPYLDRITEAADLGATAVVLGCTGLEAGITTAVRAAMPSALRDRVTLVDPADVAGRMALALVSQRCQQ